MWVDERGSKFIFYERFKDNRTGKIKRVSISLTKNTTASRKQALIALEKKIAEAQAITPNFELTLDELAEKYRLYQKKTVKLSTYKRNYHTTNTLLNMLGKDTLANSLTANFIKERLLASHYPPSTLNEYRARLRAFLNWGYENDYVDSVDYLRKFKLFKDDSRCNADEKYLEPWELTSLLQYMNERNSTNWKLLTQFLTLSGLRVGEAIALDKKDVDLTSKVIRVFKTYDSNNKVVTTTKTSCSTRDVYIQEELFRLCQLITENMNEQKNLYGYETSQYFFTSIKGDHIAYYGYNKYLREISEKILKRRITPHILRHTHASLLLSQGVDIETISRRLGHEDSRVTKAIYLHVTERLKEKDNLQIENTSIL